MLIWDSCRDSICLELCFFTFYVQLKVWDLNQQYQSQEENVIGRFSKFTYRTLGRLESIFGYNLLLNLVVFLQQTTTL